MRSPIVDRILGCVLAVAVAAAVSGPAGAQERGLHLADVQRIYVAELGTSDVARRARTTVADALRAVGFEVVDRRGQADVMLSGMVTTRARGDTPVLLFKSVVLTDLHGANVWFAKFRPSRTTERQAARIARALREAVKAAVWELAKSR